jgi:Bacterial protein of unknown function (DUF899)
LWVDRPVAGAPGLQASNGVGGSLGSDFKYDFGAAFTEEQRRNGADYNYQHIDKPEPQKEGISVFALQDGAVHHTYSTYARGTEALMENQAEIEGRCRLSLKVTEIQGEGGASLART